MVVVWRRLTAGGWWLVADSWFVVGDLRLVA